MKQTFLAMLVVLAGIITADAQTIGSSTAISGTNNVPIQVSAGVYLTNSAYFYAAQKSITLSGIASTNETVIGWYAIQFPSGMVLAPGSSNLYIIQSFTNSFASGTNGGTWNTNLFPVSFPTSWPVYMGLNIGNYTNLAYVP